MIHSRDGIDLVGDEMLNRDEWLIMMIIIQSSNVLSHSLIFLMMMMMFLRDSILKNRANGWDEVQIPNCRVAERETNALFRDTYHLMNNCTPLYEKKEVD